MVIEQIIDKTDCGRKGKEVASPKDNSKKYHKDFAERIIKAYGSQLFSKYKAETLLHGLITED